MYGQKDWDILGHWDKQIVRKSLSPAMATATMTNKLERPTQQLILNRYSRHREQCQAHALGRHDCGALLISIRPRAARSTIGAVAYHFARPLGLKPAVQRPLVQLQKTQHWRAFIPLLHSPNPAWEAYGKPVSASEGRRAAMRVSIGRPPLWHRRPRPLCHRSTPTRLDPDRHQCHARVGCSMVLWPA